MPFKVPPLIAPVVEIVPLPALNDVPVIAPPPIAPVVEIDPLPALNDVPVIAPPPIAQVPALNDVPEIAPALLMHATSVPVDKIVPEQITPENRL